MNFPKRQSESLNALPASGGALLVTHLPNVRYLCGFTGSSGVLALVRGKGGPKAAFFTDGRYTEQARTEVVQARVVIAKTAALAAAIEWLSKQKVQGFVGFESDHMTVATRDGLQRAVMGRIRIRPVSGLLERQRAIKEPKEIAQIRDAVSLGCKVFEAIVPDIKPGATETSIAAEIEYMSRRLGAEGMSFDTLVASGQRSALPHGVASLAALPERGFVILDFGVILGGYCSDMTRTLHLGKPDQRARTIYEAVLEAQLAGIKAVTPGAKCSEVDYAARKVLEKAGLAKHFTHSTGHGVGIEIHEQPGLRKTPRTAKSAGKARKRVHSSGGTQFGTLLPGMVVTIEPGVYIPGFGGVRIEDMVVVTETGCEVLTTSPKELIVV